ncbi:MAG: redoxin domain-containing protein [Candidatus Aminicenantes bacterium]|jgi:peroxiredoxin/tetratricopeptide (TPR) repeat protein
MRKTFLIVLCAGFLCLSFCAQKEPTGKFSYSPEKPIPGAEITVQYYPGGTSLEKAEDIYLVAYSYTKGPPEAKDFLMTKKGKTWTATFSTDEKSRGILIKFVHEEEVDNNEKNGYVIPLYEKNGNPVAGGLAGLAEAYSSWGRYFLDMEGDMDLAFSYFEEEFDLHPELKREYLVPYLTIIAGIKRETGREIILKELDELTGKSDLTEEEYSLIVGWYKRLNQTVKVQKYSAVIRDKYPQGTFVQEERFREFYTTKDVNKKIALLEKFKKDFPESDFTSAMYMYVCFAYRDRGEYTRIKEYLEKYPEEVSWSLYNNLAWGMAEKDIELELAAELAAKGVELARGERENPKTEKPSYVTEREWKQQAEIGLGMILDTHGFILLKLDRAKDALPVLEEAVLLSKGKNLEINERYAEALVQSGSFEKAVEEIGKFIQEGYSTSKMEDLFRQAYLQHTGNDKEASEQLLKMKKVANEKTLAELKETMLDSPAPDFALEDLEGQSISLVNLRGKIVIIDFWATWCRPCIESFPGMKQAVEKYRDDERVLFLFINSWERVEDWKKNATDFITKNNYPFHVLLDTENKVITSFGVDGIPTKFVIDKKGKIRFKSVGFSGSTDQLVEELSQMIEMLR